MDATGTSDGTLLSLGGKGGKDPIERNFQSRYKSSDDSKYEIK